ncbi:MAG: AAA family ATPase [Patescibacteria group bacterium]
MKRVILTIGPQGSGKTTFCSRVIFQYPAINFVCRDTILNDLYGKAWMDPYTNCAAEGMKKVWEQVKNILSKRGDVVLLFDRWNESPSERICITERLREYGSEYIEGWYFITPEKRCLQWYEQRERSSHALYSIKRHYRRYHACSVALEQGFDEIIEIDPLTTHPNELIGRFLRRQLAFPFGEEYYCMEV